MKGDVYCQFYFGLGLGIVRVDKMTVLILPFVIIFIE